MNNTFFLKSAPLLLAASLALGGAHTAQAQISATGGFLFTAPTSTSLLVHPGDIITFSGSFTNLTQLEQLDDVTIGLSPGNYGGKFTFASPFFADVAEGQTRNFMGTLKISKTATFSPTFFYLNANGTGDDSGEEYNLGSDNFKVTLAPVITPVPEASTSLSFGLLLSGLGLSAACVRRRRASAGV